MTPHGTKAPPSRDRRAAATSSSSPPRPRSHLRQTKDREPDHDAPLRTIRVSGPVARIHCHRQFHKRRPPQREATKHGESTVDTAEHRQRPDQITTAGRRVRARWSPAALARPVHAVAVAGPPRDDPDPTGNNRLPSRSTPLPECRCRPYQSPEIARSRAPTPVRRCHRWTSSAWSSGGNQRRRARTRTNGEQRSDRVRRDPRRPRPMRAESARIRGQWQAKPRER